MVGGKIFLAFLFFFAVATLAVPIPLFPGNVIAPLFSSLGTVSFHTALLDAVANGLFYGFIIWIVYVSVSRKLEELEAANNLRCMRASSSKDSANCPVHFGYLSKLPPGGSIPEECYSCPRIEQCFNS